MLGDFASNIALGIGVALTFENLIYCAIGVTIGTIAGVIPGLGSMATMSMLLPLTFHLAPTPALIMLGGIYYGTTYGGSTAAILLNIPGTPATAVTCLDGFPMAQKGRAGVALFMTTIASFFGASVGITLMLLFAPLIAGTALQFGPAEYFSLMVMGLLAASTLSTGSAIKGVAMVGLGILFGLAGIDVTSGATRFTFGILELLDGVSLVVLAMGIFGLAQVVVGNSDMPTARYRAFKLRDMLPSRDEMNRSWMPMVRGSSLGSFFGILPGVGPTVASFMSYAIEKRVADDPSRFGHGAIEGIMGPESTNNAAEQTAFIPTMTLGVPGSASMALILGVLIMNGIAPGPSLITQSPDLFWGLVMSFWIGNLMLLVLNIPFIGLWVRLLTIPYRVLFPAIIVFICIGAFSLNNNTFDILMVMAFGALGYLMRLLAFPAAPFLLGFVLGPMMEEHFRRAMVLSQGDFTTFVTRPISLSFVLLTILIVLAAIATRVRFRLAD